MSCDGIHCVICGGDPGSRYCRDVCKCSKKDLFNELLNATFVARGATDLLDGIELLKGAESAEESADAEDQLADSLDYLAAKVAQWKAHER